MLIPSTRRARLTAAQSFCWLLEGAVPTHAWGPPRLRWLPCAGTLSLQDDRPGALCHYPSIRVLQVGSRRVRAVTHRSRCMGDMQRGVLIHRDRDS